MAEEKRGASELGLGLKMRGPKEVGSERRRGETVDAGIPIGKKDFHSCENSIVGCSLLVHPSARSFR